MVVTTRRKYLNSPFWINNLTGERVSKLPKLDKSLRTWTWWDSELEWKVYQELRRHYPADSIVRQAEIEIVPQSTFFPSVKWDVDFAVKVIEADGVFQWHYIEAKGEWITQDTVALTAFTRLIKTLAFHSPEIYSRLHVVGYSDFELGTGISVKNYKQLSKGIK